MYYQMMIRIFMNKMPSIEEFDEIVLLPDVRHPSSIYTVFGKPATWQPFIPRLITGHNITGILITRIQIGRSGRPNTDTFTLKLRLGRFQLVLFHENSQTCRTTLGSCHIQNSEELVNKPPRYPTLYNLRPRTDFFHLRV